MRRSRLAPTSRRPFGGFPYRDHHSCLPLRRHPVHRHRPLQPSSKPLPHPLYHPRLQPCPRGTPYSRRSPPAATGSRSRLERTPFKSYGSRRTCSATPFRRAMRPRFSIEPLRCSSPTWPEGNTQPRAGPGPRAAWVRRSTPELVPERVRGRHGQAARSSARPEAAPDGRAIEPPTPATAAEVPSLAGTSLGECAAADTPRAYFAYWSAPRKCRDT